MGFRLSLFLLVIVMMMGGQVLAWDCAGHMLTTRIAENLLSREIRDYFYNIAEYHMTHYPRVTSMTEMACWPDDIKRWTYFYSEWHFVDQCFLPSNKTQDGNVTCPPHPPTPNINQSLPIAAEKVISKNITNEERSFWLAIVLHMMGDIHQPLHTCTLFDEQFPHGDDGGNDFMVMYQGKQWHLHPFHDTIGDLIPWWWPNRPLAENQTEVNEVQTLADSLIETGTFNGNVTDAMTRDLRVKTMLQEGFDAAKKYSYLNGKLVFNSTLTPEYVSDLRYILQSKIALGGRRLANLLTEIYNILHDEAPQETSHLSRLSLLW